MAMFSDNRPFSSDDLLVTLKKVLQDMRSEGTYTGNGTMFSETTPRSGDDETITAKKWLAQLQKA